MLKYPNHWRINPPPDGEWRNETISRAAVQDFSGWINRIAQHRVECIPEQETIETFKGAFSTALGQPHDHSSSHSWAISDLDAIMVDTASNAPQFIEAFWDGCQLVRAEDQRAGRDPFYVPDASLVNQILQKHRNGYKLDPPRLLLLDETEAVVQLPDQPDSLEERAKQIVDESLARAEHLLAQGRGREAVQETLWLLESVTTVFKGYSTESATVKGTYFNRILKDLEVAEGGGAFQQVIGWVKQLHGYLSSPTGGGIRHGMDLKEGVEIQMNEARLFVNLARSYTFYFLAEHKRLLGEP